MTIKNYIGIVQGHNDTHYYLTDKMSGAFLPALKMAHMRGHVDMSEFYDVDGFIPDGMELHCVMISSPGRDDVLFFDKNYYGVSNAAFSHRDIFDRYGENEFLELKSSFLCKPEICKQIASFANAKSNKQHAYLIVGVDDERNVIGLEHDLKKSGSTDAIEHMVRNNAVQCLNDTELMNKVEFDWKKRNGLNYCVITIPTNWSRVVFFKGNQVYLRCGNTMRCIKGDEMCRFIAEKNFNINF